MIKKFPWETFEKIPFPPHKRSLTPKFDGSDSAVLFFSLSPFLPLMLGKLLVRDYGLKIKLQATFHLRPYLEEVVMH